MATPICRFSSQCCFHGDIWFTHSSRLLSCHPRWLIPFTPSLQREPNGGRQGQMHCKRENTLQTAKRCKHRNVSITEAKQEQQTYKPTKQIGKKCTANEENTRNPKTARRKKCCKYTPQWKLSLGGGAT